ncbi:MAG: hypothetical protein J0I09_10365 [Sphingobacteriia bacterium]|nr:hypothetical protein [Sphingobacteriia bacterium]
MRKTIFILPFLLFILLTPVCFGAVPSLPMERTHKVDSAQNMRAQADKQRLNQLKVFTGLTLDQYQKITGRKMGLLERISFKMTQRKAKKMLNHYAYGDDITVFQKISWFFKGLLFGPLALLFGYLFLKDDERELIKWIWFGTIGFAALLILFLAAA